MWSNRVPACHPVGEPGWGIHWPDSDWRAPGPGASTPIKARAPALLRETERLRGRRPPLLPALHAAFL